MGTMEPAPAPRPVRVSRRSTFIAAAIVATVLVAFLVGRGVGRKRGQQAGASASASIPAQVAAGKTSPPPQRKTASASPVFEQVPEEPAPSPVIVTNFGTRPNGTEYRKYFGDVKNVSNAEAAFVKVVIRCTDRGQDYHEFTYVSPTKLQAGGVGTFEGSISAPSGRDWTAEVEGHPETRVAEAPMSQPTREPVRGPAALAPASAPMTQSVATPLHIPARVVDFNTEVPDSSGDVWFSGEAANPSPTETQSVEVLATAYDEQGRVISTSTAYVQPIPMPPASRGTFRSYLSSRGVRIARVDVRAIDK